MQPQAFRQGNEKKLFGRPGIFEGFAKRQASLGQAPCVPRKIRQGPYHTEQGANNGHRSRGNFQSFGQSQDDGLATTRHPAAGHGEKFGAAQQHLKIGYAGLGKEGAFSVQGGLIGVGKQEHAQQNGMKSRHDAIGRRRQSVKQIVERNRFGPFTKQRAVKAVPGGSDIGGIVFVGRLKSPVSGLVLAMQTRGPQNGLVDASFRRIAFYPQRLLIVVFQHPFDEVPPCGGCSGGHRALYNQFISYSRSLFVEVVADI